MNRNIAPAARNSTPPTPFDLAVVMVDLVMHGIAGLVGGACVGLAAPLVRGLL